MITLYQPPDNCMINIELYSNISWAHTSIWHSNGFPWPCRCSYSHQKTAQCTFTSPKTCQTSLFVTTPPSSTTSVGKRPSSCEWTLFCTSSEKSVFTRGCQTRSTRSRTIIYRSCLMIALYQPPDNCMINIELYSNMPSSTTSVGKRLSSVEYTELAKYSLVRWESIHFTGSR
jgi:hypothetical protein